MALGPEGMATGCSKCNQKRCIELDSKSAAVLLSPEDNRRAATLFLNLAQTLLKLPRITWARAAALALEAATVSFFHSLLSQEVRNLTPTCQFWLSTSHLNQRGFFTDKIKIQGSSSEGGARLELDT